MKDGPDISRIAALIGDPARANILSALTSGKALGSQPLRELFALAPHEQAVCFASIGRAVGRKPGKPRPQPEQYLSHLPA